MKNKYFSSHDIGRNGLSWVLLVMLWALPMLGYAQSVSLVPAEAGDPQNFGAVRLGEVSASKAYTVSGSGLDPEASVSILVPNAFTASTNNSTFVRGGVITLPTDASGNLAATTIYLRFAPNAAPAPASPFINRTVFAQSTFTNADGQPGIATSSPIISLRGEVVPAALAVNKTELAFGTITEGLVSNPQEFTVTGSSLANDVTVTAPTGFLVRVGTTGTFTQSVTLPRTNFSVNTVLQAQFAPATAGTYAGDITVTSAGNGNAATALRVTGTATARPTGPFIVANPTELDFETVTGSGSAQILTFSINAGNLRGDLVLTGSNASITFRDATEGGDFINGPIRISPAQNGTVAVRTIEVKLTGPIPQGPFTGNITATSTQATPVVVAIKANSTGGTSVINVSQSALSLFSTVPNVPSAVQSYQLSGTDLLNSITVTAPSSFQISLEPNFENITTTGNTLVVNRDAGSSDVSPVTIYVRFLPTSAFSTSANVLNSSSPALGVAVRVSGTSEPSVQLLNSTQQVTNIVVNTRSSAQAITVRAERVLQPVTISQLLSANATFNPRGTQQFEISRDGVNFTIDTVKLKPNATTYSINQQIYVRYRPTNLGSAQSTLQFQSNDFDNKNVQNFGANALLSGLPIDTQPSLRSEVSVIRNGTSATVTFALPANYAAAGYGEGRLIVASENPVLPTGDQPKDGISYQTGNQNYGDGPQVAPGYFAVFAGPNSTVTVTGLDLRKTYYFYTFEFNNIDNAVQVIASGAENYLSPPDQNVIPGIPAPSPLPVTLVSFDAKVRGKRVALNWVTANELNNKGFEVQRSKDASNFETILSKDGRGTTSTGSTYNAFDEKPLTGVSYYRLKQIDFDGTYSFSSPVVVTFLNSGDVTMYPNPVEDYLTIDMAGAASGVRATITDIAGRVIQTQVLGEDSKLKMDGLQSGTYLVTVGEGNMKVTRRIVKK